VKGKIFNEVTQDKMDRFRSAVEYAEESIRENYHDEEESIKIAGKRYNVKTEILRQVVVYRNKL